jgi:hypothetical protein
VRLGSRILRVLLYAKFEARGVEFFVRSGTRILRGTPALVAIGPDVLGILCCAVPLLD